MKKTISLVLILALGLAAEVANADYIFGTPTNLGPTVNSAYGDVGEGTPCISADGLSLYFSSDRAGGYGDWDLWVTTRPTIDDDWGTPINLGPPVNTSFIDGTPNISADGLSLYFSSGRPGGFGNIDLYVATRETTDNNWSTPVNLGPTVNSLADEMAPCISADGLQLYFSGWRAAFARPGGYGKVDLWVTTRDTIDDEWGTPMNLGPTVNSSSWDDGPSISADGLSLFFRSTRPGGYGFGDIWVTTRATKDDDWSAPVNLGPTVNSSGREEFANISADGSTLYFGSDRPGGSGNFDLWQVPIIPVVDFNGDGKVDSADMCIMVDHWHTDEPSCDIGPMPWGDGIVDVQDLIVLAEHLFEEVKDPTLIAHWALDETEGDIAHDTVGNNDGTVNGGSLWQPAAGKIDGALQFDGTDDYVSTDFVLNPADGAFSVIAWVKGGAPSQVVISQTGGVDWLSTDPSEGYLMTELKSGGRTGGGPLLSQTVVTDGDWHRIGLVWDGSYRTLYADGTDVAKDTEPQGHFVAVHGGLYIGAGKTLDAGSFFSGLIDDVRIYDRVVIPMESRDTSREVRVNVDDAGIQVELEQGQILVITLESNPTTGYGWEVAEIQESILEQMGEAEFKPSQTGEPPLVGAGGWEIFRFKAISAGQMTLQLVYRRSWEEGVEPINTFSIEVVVN